MVDQKTLVKRREVRWTVYVLTLSLSLPDTSSQIFDRKPSAEPCQTLFSLFDRDKTRDRLLSKTSEWFNG